VVQFFIEYDPKPPFDSGHVSKASEDTQKAARKMMDIAMPADQHRLIPKIARRRFIDLVRTRKIAPLYPGDPDAYKKCDRHMAMHP
jgi:hypothetical protein